MILITGATGHIGRRTAELLAQDRQPLRLLVREPARAPQLNADIVQGDYANPGSLTAAFAGIEAAFIVSGYAKPGERALLHKNAIDAAARAGVTHVVYLSFQGASPDSKFPMSRDHYQTEGYLAASGLPFTVLRDSLYMDIVPEMFDTQGVIRGPAAQGSAAFVSREDVAQVAAAVLRGPRSAGGPYEVTGPQALTLSEAAVLISDLTGRALGFEDESVEAGRDWRSRLGAPAWEIDTWLGSYEAIAAGELSQIGDGVLRATGRSPTDFESYFRAHPGLLARLRQ